MDCTDVPKSCQRNTYKDISLWIGYIQNFIAMTLRVAKLHCDAVIPVRAEPGSAGMDLVSIEDVIIPAGGRTVVRTGLAFEFPRDVYARIAPRSGLAVKWGIHVLAGVVDSSYRGEVKVGLANLGDTEVVLEKGSRVAQVIMERIVVADAVEVEYNELGVSDRGVGGFGSSGV